MTTYELKSTSKSILKELVLGVVVASVTPVTAIIFYCFIRGLQALIG